MSDGLDVGSTGIWGGRWADGRRAAELAFLLGFLPTPLAHGPALAGSDRNSRRTLKVVVDCRERRRCSPVWLMERASVPGFTPRAPKEHIPPKADGTREHSNGSLREAAARLSSSRDAYDLSGKSCHAVPLLGSPLVESASMPQRAVRTATMWNPETLRQRFRHPPFCNSSSPVLWRQCEKVGAL